MFCFLFLSLLAKILHDNFGLQTISNEKIANYKVFFEGKVGAW